MKSLTDGKTVQLRGSLLARVQPWLTAFVCIVLAETVALGNSTSAGQTPEGDIASVPWVGEPGIQETVYEIMAREKQLTALGIKPARSKPVLRPDRQGLPQNPNSPDQSRELQTASAPALNEPVPLAPQILGTSFTGATYADTISYPPDTMGAVGPTQFIVAVNGRIRSFNKFTGIADGALNVSMDTFFNSVMTPPTSNNFTSDPHIRYDRFSGRWFVIIIDVPGGTTALPNRVLLAVSNGSTISSASSFTFFYFQHDTVTPAGDTGNFADFPTLGIDVNALYIGDNVFTPAGAFVGCSGFVVRKSSILGAGPIVVKAFRGLVPSSSSSGPYTPQGVDNDDPAATEGYFIGVDNAAFGTLIIRRVSTPGETPTISANIALTVPATAYPVTVPHQGNTSGANGYLDASDDRLFAAHIRNGRLWTAHNIQVNSSGVASSSRTNIRNGSRWYEIQNLTSTPSLVQSGTIFDSAASNPKSFWMPTIMVSGQGHVAMGFSTAGNTNYVNAGTVGRLSGDTAGTMQTPVDYTASNTAYNPPGDTGGTGGRRWGDFSYTSLDPSDDMTMWTIQEFCDASNSYGLRVVKLLAPPPATPISCSPSSVTQGQTNVSVTLTGSVISGSGFFDPGTNFPNRLAAVVNGSGVTVTSVTFSNATNITLLVTVSAGAATGARTITVTNPDGQAVTSAASILTINATPAHTISSSKTGNGTISPEGAVTVANNGTTNFLITASNGSHIASIMTNGHHITGSPYSGNGFVSTNYVWNNITADGTIAAAFAVNVYTLTVVSAQGGAYPGTTTTNWGSILSQWVTNSPVSLGVSTQVVCIAGTVSGNAYAQANFTNVTLTLTNTATLTWQWQTQYRLTTQTNGSGSVTATNSWYAAGSNAVLAANSGTYWHFTGWSGDTNGCLWGGNVITGAMTQARTIVANFAENLAPLGTPEAWLAQYGLTNGTPASAELTDTDADGMLAWQEYVAGSVPTNHGSVFLTLITMSNSAPWITWAPNLGTTRVYTVVGRTNLIEGTWGPTNTGSHFFRANVFMP
jgi:hypothetical protein